VKLITAQICRRVELTPEDVATMFHVFRCYYEQTNRSLFESDLANKSDVILLRDEGGDILGFSTLSVIEFNECGFKGRAIFSGDTIIQHEYWGTQALPLAFASYAASLKAERAEEPLYWLLISKGYRTYRYLPLLFRDYYPRHDAATPLRIQQLIDWLARKKFGEHYDGRDGVVRFPESRGQLCSTWAEVPAPALRKPEVRFFLDRNPGYAEGHELVCLAELSVENLRSVGRQRFEDTLQLALA
jgi:hypothetical protein